MLFKIYDRPSYTTQLWAVNISNYISIFNASLLTHFITSESIFRVNVNSSLRYKNMKNHSNSTINSLILALAYCFIPLELSCSSWISKAHSKILISISSCPPISDEELLCLNQPFSSTFLQLLSTIIDSPVLDLQHRSFLLLLAWIQTHCLSWLIDCTYPLIYQLIHENIAIIDVWLYLEAEK